MKRKKGSPNLTLEQRKGELRNCANWILLSQKSSRKKDTPPFSRGEISQLEKRKKGYLGGSGIGKQMARRERRRREKAETMREPVAWVT